MINLVIHNEIDSDRQKAIATARMISYAADDASALGLRECSQLLYFAVDLITMKFNLNNKEALLKFESGNKNGASRQKCRQERMIK